MCRQLRRRRQTRSIAALPVALALWPWLSLMQSVPGDDPTPAPQAPKIAAASDEAQRAIAAIQRPDDWRVKLFAAEPMVANPVALHVDNQSRVFVCESFRQERGVEDNRNHPEWLYDDLAAQTVADRLAYIRKHLGDKAAQYTRQDDRIRLLFDSSADGTADQSTVFADRFNSIESGTGAGVLSYRDFVLFTCIPHLWRLRDEDGDSVAEQREKLISGFGVRFAFRGHDLHGLTIGPDGRLYFSIGDRGYNVSEYVRDPESGAVFRCELDGSNLEVVATGMRNPQELAFNDFGDLFTGDNNSDSGDRARLVHVVSGGDSGWRMSYQYLPDRGPFNREKIWHPFHEETPAYIVPPIDNFIDGPSGLSYYPGTGLSRHFDRRFFLCDFRGQTQGSGVWTFRLERDGAFFRLAEAEKTIWNLLATDVDFGPDGRIYVSDWVHGWEGEGKGRVYTFADNSQGESEPARQVAQLLASGPASLGDDLLVSLLGHADRRVRMMAQFELVDRGKFDLLRSIAVSDQVQLARIHAIWGLAQMARRPTNGFSPPLIEIYRQLTSDADPEIRAQACRVAGQSPPVATQLADQLAQCVLDPEPRVRFFAALGLHHPRDEVIQMLEQNADRDPMLRHAGIMSMVNWGRHDKQHGENSLAGLIEHPSPSVRLALCVALRKLNSPLIAELLNDAEPRIVLEAARAVYDLPVESALPQLAEMLDRVNQPDALVRRAIHANVRLGQADNARAIARFAARPEAPAERRQEALRLLADWSKPQPLDGLLGMWRPLPVRSVEDARQALLENLPSILAAPETVATLGATVAAGLQIDDVAPILTQIAVDISVSPAARRDALLSLRALGDQDTNSLVDNLLDDPHALVRATCQAILASRDPPRALRHLGSALDSQSRLERQMAFQTLGTMTDATSAGLLLRWLRRLQDGDVPADVQLDLLMAAEQRPETAIRELRAQWTQAASGAGTLFAICMEGGDAARGNQVFFQRLEVSCVRCHKVNEVGGDVGPDLTRIAAEKDRRYLLEAIVEPNKTVAAEFQSVMVVDIEGQTHIGIVRHEDERELRLVTAEGNQVTLRQDEIDERRDAKSSMPEDVIEKLSRQDVRDLVEFLSTLK